ncbi:hypothetical protein [Desulfococcus sp.]|uniref:hypothetical protein n=1 Tax=Desulfococcus sp. TaxID=2025834 RepID=UPI003593A5E0
MKPIPFDPATDMAPLPFTEAHLELAREMKQRGLAWRPHVGCFVWDPEARIEADSPFPLRVYFVLSLPRFISIFGSSEAMAEQLVWVPTWHQARQTAARLGVAPEDVAWIWTADPAPGDELLVLYGLIRDALAGAHGRAPLQVPI